MVKTILVKSTSVFLLFVMLCTAVSASSVTYLDVSSKHWAYDSIAAVTEAGLMHGKVKNEIFSKNDTVNAAEIYTTLYRLAGEVEPISDFTNGIAIDQNSSKTLANIDKWYSKPWEWAIYNGIAEVNKERSTYRYGSDRLNYNSVGEVSQYYVCGDDLFLPATRCDVIKALYYYVTTYLGVEDTDSTDLNRFTDWKDKGITPKPWFDKTTEEFCSIYKKTNTTEFTAAWEWAVAEGIVEGYPDGTLGLYNLVWEKSWTDSPPTVYYLVREQRFVTRAEYAVILDRFMQYLEEMK